VRDRSVNWTAALRGIKDPPDDRFFFCLLEVVEADPSWSSSEAWRCKDLTDVWNPANVDTLERIWDGNASRRMMFLPR